MNNFVKLEDGYYAEIGAVVLTPSSGMTYCTITSGKFSDTYDNNINTGCGFKTGQTCLSEWHWSNPVTVNAINFHTKNYDKDNYIAAIWGLVGSSWVLLWNGELHLLNNAWYGHGTITPCANCTGIRISQYHKTGAATPVINEIGISYEPPPPPPPPEEGKAAIVGIVTPSEFMPGDTVNITTKIINQGVTDSLFIRLKNKDTGTSLADKTVTVLENKTYEWTTSIKITQTTDFHGLAEAGHVT